MRSSVVGLIKQLSIGSTLSVGGVKSSLHEYRNISDIDWFDPVYPKANYSKTLNLENPRLADFDLEQESISVTIDSNGQLCSVGRKL